MTWIFALLVSVTSWAYIPDYSMIISHAADQHGKGVYWIEQEVTYHRADNEAFSVKESWLIGDESNMRVTLEGRGPLRGLVQGTIVFSGSNKYFIESDGTSVRSQRLGEDWLEPLFHFRSSRYLQSKLQSLGVATTSIRLSRVGGAIAWAIGNTPGSAPQPTLWLEQDQFVLRKLRGQNQTLLRANDYSKFEEGLWYPKQRFYNFSTYAIEVQTTRVKWLGRRKPDEAGFKPSGLTAKKDGVRLPEIDGLKEFYSRFR